MSTLKAANFGFLSRLLACFLFQKYLIGECIDESGRGLKIRLEMLFL